MRKILHFGSPFESPRVKFETGRMSGVGFRAVFGGDEQDAGLSVHALGRHVHVGLYGFIPQSIRSAAYDWSKRAAKAAEDRVQRARATGVSQDELWRIGRRTYGYQFDPFNGREVSFSVSSEYVAVNLWTDMDHNVGVHYGVIPFAVAFGEPTVNEEIVDSRATAVRMPEGDYAAEWSLRRSVYTYEKRLARIPGIAHCVNRVYYNSCLKIPDGVPFPGKGENSWDCGDDAIYSAYMPMSDESWQYEGPGTATRRIALEVMEKRMERGGDLMWTKRDEKSEKDNGEDESADKADSGDKSRVRVRVSGDNRMYPSSGLRQTEGSVAAGEVKSADDDDGDPRVYAYELHEVERAEAIAEGREFGEDDNDTRWTIDPSLCNPSEPHCVNCGRGYAHDMACPIVANAEPVEAPAEALSDRILTFLRGVDQAYSMRDIAMCLQELPNMVEVDVLFIRQPEVKAAYENALIELADRLESVSHLGHIYYRPRAV